MAEFNPRKRPPELDLAVLKKIFGSGLLWAALALLVIVVLLLVSVRVGRVEGTEVGLLLNKIDGKVTVIPQSGTQIYNGITQEFFTLDKTLQTMEMSQDASRGDRKSRDDLKVKTMDGSDVYVDLTVQYRIIPDMAATVLATSGPADAFKRKWIRDYVRSISRNHLGELTTEEFYDSGKRDKQILTAEQVARKRLKPFGILIDRIVIPSKPHFYKAYEEMIKKKKLADQAVLEEQSKALAAKQRQQTNIVEETNKNNVAVEQFRGKMQELVIAAEAEGERVRKSADAYYDKTTIGAQAGFYSLQKEGESILAKKKAEAEGIEALKQALEGEGGRNMVMLEYARRLKDMRLTGQPFVIRGETERFEHLTPASVEGARGAAAGGE